MQSYNQYHVTYNNPNGTTLFNTCFVLKNFHVDIIALSFRS